MITRRAVVFVYLFTILLSTVSAELIELKKTEGTSIDQEKTQHTFDCIQNLGQAMIENPVELSDEKGVPKEISNIITSECQGITKENLSQVSELLKVIPNEKKKVISFKNLRKKISDFFNRKKKQKVKQIALEGSKIAITVPVAFVIVPIYCFIENGMLPNWSNIVFMAKAYQNLKGCIKDSGVVFYSAVDSLISSKFS